MELDASDRLESIELVPKIGLLDFDAKAEEIASECGELQEEADKLIDARLWLRPKEFDEVCADIVGELRGVNTPRFKKDGLLRVFWAQREGSADAVRIKRAFGFVKEIHFDDRITMPFRTSMSALAYQTCKSQFAHKDVLKDLRAGKMNRYRSAVKWQQLEWCWAIPVFRNDSDPEPAGVLGIESDVPLHTFSDDVGTESSRRKYRPPARLIEIRLSF